MSNELSDEAQKIIIVKTSPTEDKYTFLKVIVCRSGVFAKTPAINIERCKRDLQNRASLIGGTHIELSIRNIAPQTNVVVMSANVYKKKN